MNIAAASLFPTAGWVGVFALKKGSTGDRFVVATVESPLQR